MIPGPQSCTILVIDDEDMVRALVTEILEEDGHVVFGAAGGAEALTLLQAVVPDLILLDLLMPRMSGADVIQHLRADGATRRIPIVVMTSASAAEANELNSAGVIGFIPKPFDPGEFSRLIAELIHVTKNRKRAEP